MSTTKPAARWLRRALLALVACASPIAATAADGLVVVLPFQNETKRKDIDFWRAGFQELLIQTLAARGVGVARRDAVAAAWTAPEAGGTLDPRQELARLRPRLAAAVVVTGVFRNGKETVELLVDTWNETRQSRISAVHQVLGEDALFDAAELQAAAAADGPLPLSVRGRGPAQPSPEAFHDFVLGSGFRSQARADLPRAIEAFQDAIAKSPEWVLPYLHLLATYVEAGDTPNALRVLPIVRSRRVSLPAEERGWLERLERQLETSPGAAAKP